MLRHLHQKEEARAKLTTDLSYGSRLFCLIHVTPPLMQLHQRGISVQRKKNRLGHV